jgi:pSer/pThr/pTyr-binding forkhead associated (FHA) protein
VTVGPLTLPEALARVAAAGTDLSGLEVQWGPGALVGQLLEENTAWSYRTESRPTPLPPEADGLGLRPEMSVWPVRKRPGARSFQQVILVGRAANNDVIVVHSQVSKLHARLHADGAGHTVEDAGSSNGTFVNGVPVAPGQLAVLKTGDTLSLGAVLLTYFSTSRLLRVLAAHLGKPR